MRRLLSAFVVAGLALAMASAKTYSVKLYQSAFVGDHELKAGEYKVDVQNDKAVIKSGKMVTEARVKIETQGQKYASTTVRMAEDGGKMKLREISLGGTYTKLVFFE